MVAGWLDRSLELHRAQLFDCCSPLQARTPNDALECSHLHTSSGRLHNAAVFQCSVSGTLEMEQSLSFHSKESVKNIRKIHKKRKSDF